MVVIELSDGFIIGSIMFVSGLIIGGIGGYGSGAKLYMKHGHKIGWHLLKWEYLYEK